MNIIHVLKYGVITSCFVSVVSLSILVLKTFSFGKKPLYAEPGGDVKKGIIYAFGKGMLPWEKESAVNHLPSYIGGILYHLGVFGALLYLMAVIIPIGLPYLVVTFVRILLLVGIFSGGGLLLKRILSPKMRVLSCPDDFTANIIVDIFMLAAFFHTFFPGLTPLFFLVAIVMFLYMPLGKIRHCFFFFYIRILFGMFYGRRNIFPPKGPKLYKSEHN
jgi:hypothetical protein